MQHVKRKQQTFQQKIFRCNQFWNRKIFTTGIDCKKPTFKLEIIGFYQPERRSGALRFNPSTVYHVYRFSVLSVR